MYHKSNLGRFGDHLKTNDAGYVPERGDDPLDFLPSNLDIEDPEDLTWWLADGFPNWIAEAEAATGQAEQALGNWQKHK